MQKLRRLLTGIRRRSVRKGSRSSRWLSRTLEGDERKRTARELRRHRQKHFTEFGYPRNRNFAWFKSNGFIAESYLKKLQRFGRKLKVLDSGAGFLGMSADIKKVFGKKAFVTALNVSHPKMSRETETAIQNVAKHVPVVNEHFEKLKAAEKRVLETVDEMVVCAAENFRPKTRYDVIFDIYGPIEHSSHKEAVLEVYLNALRNGGKVLLADYSPLFLTRFGQESELCKRTGSYFKAQDLPGGIIELTKHKK